MLSTLNSVITGALAMGNFGLEKAIYFQLILLGVFVVATLVGYKLISNVPTLLHTPLMSGMNALSGVTVLGALSASASLSNSVRRASCFPRYSVHLQSLLQWSTSSAALWSPTVCSA